MAFDKKRPLSDQIRERFSELWPFADVMADLDAALRKLQRDLLDEVEAGRWQNDAADDET